MKRFILIVLLFLLIAGAILALQKLSRPEQNDSLTQPISTTPPIISHPTATPTLKKPSISKILNNSYHVYQSFNNCGPAALSMALSYYGINETQDTLGKALRPFQNPQGDNDDKSVTLDEIADKAREYGLEAYHRTNGSIDLMKLFLSYDLPVITRTWLHENEDIGHYRVVKGYDDTTGEIVQDDSMQGPNLRFSYREFNAMWDKFGYEYVILVPKEKIVIAKEIMGENYDEIKSWENAVAFNETILKENTDNMYARFNLSVALYYVGDYAGVIREFETVEHKLSPRTLWYQIEPIQAYAKLGRYERVMSLTDEILTHENRSFSELYIIRGDILKEQGNVTGAKEQYKKALFYNQNLKSAQERINSL